MIYFLMFEFTLIKTPDDSGLSYSVNNSVTLLSLSIVLILHMIKEIVINKINIFIFYSLEFLSDLSRI
jgi:hypothetical protein